MKIRVIYYTGWHFIMKECKKIKTEKKLEVEIIYSDDVYKIIKTDTLEFFSWSNGHTIPSNTYVLYPDGSMGYINSNSEIKKWIHSEPKWTLNN